MVMQQRVETSDVRIRIASLIISIDESLKILLKSTDFNCTFICSSAKITTTKVRKFAKSL